MKLIPSIIYRAGQSATFTRRGDSLEVHDNISGDTTVLDLSGDWAALEWDEDADQGLIRQGVKAAGVPTLTVLAYQPESRLRLSGSELAEAEAPITLSDGESVTFPDYLEMHGDA